MESTFNRDLGFPYDHVVLQVWCPQIAKFVWGTPSLVHCAARSVRRLEPQSGIDVDIWACKIAWPIDHFRHEKLSVVTFWFKTAFVPSPVAVVVLLASTRTVWEAQGVATCHASQRRRGPDLAREADRMRHRRVIVKAGALRCCWRVNIWNVHFRVSFLWLYKCCTLDSEFVPGMDCFNPNKVSYHGSLL